MMMTEARCPDCGKLRGIECFGEPTSCIASLAPANTDKLMRWLNGEPFSHEEVKEFKAEIRCRLAFPGLERELPAPAPAVEVERIDAKTAVSFLISAAAYFENEAIETKEDKSHWACVYNAEGCRKSADLIESLVGALEECVVQIEYLGDKFTKTGTSEAVLARARNALRSTDPGKQNPPQTIKPAAD